MATLVNFQQIRADRSVDAPTVTDMDGVTHDVGAFPLDFFLEVLELQDKFGGSLTTDELIPLLKRIKAMIVAVIPTFPVGRLTFQEAQQLIEMLVSSIQPAGALEDAPRDAEGESMPPAG